MTTVTLRNAMEKNPQLKLSDIQLLKDWCKKQPHLPKIEDIYLVMFLHSNYYQMKATKNTIEAYYTTRTHVPEFFCDRDPLQAKGLQHAFTVGSNVLLKGLTKDGYKIAYSVLLDTNPSHYDFNDNVKYFLMVCDTIFLSDGTNDGYVYILDVNGVSFGHIARLGLLSMKKMLYYIQEAIPIRLKAIHVLNTSPIFEMILNMIKPFMKKEMINMLHLHSTIQSASEYIPIELLPNEAGGKAGSILQLAEIQKKKLEEYREWFLVDEQTRRVNENLRIGKSKSANDLFGMDGSFKQFEID